MKLFKRLLLHVFGYAIVSFGISVIIQANIGLFPYDAISSYISDLLGNKIGIGTASIIVSFIIAVLNFILIKKWRTFLSMMNAVIVGVLIDLFMILVSGISVTGTFYPYIVGLVGLIISGIGIAVVIFNESLPVAPSEQLLIYLNTKTHRPLISKLIIEGSLLITAIILGVLTGNFEYITWVTFALIFLISPVVDLAYKVLKKFISIY